MPHRRITLSKFIIEDQRRTTQHGAELASLLNDVQTACKFIAAAVSRGALEQKTTTAPATINVQGEAQKPLDVIANEIMLATCEWGGQLCGMVSEELEAPYRIPAQYPRGKYLLVFDPLDGSSNIDVNITVGTIFSILRRPGRRDRSSGRGFPPAGHATGRRRLCAVRAGVDAGADDGRGCPRIHAGPRYRRLHADAS